MTRIFRRLALLGRKPPALPGGWRLQGRPEDFPRRIVVEDSLLAGCREVTQICLPLSPVPRLTLRAGSGTLLLAAAMTVMADTSPDEAALLELAASLGFRPETFLRGCPVLAETSLGGVPGRVVRDGKGQRAYFLGEAAALAPLCSRIWDGGERPMTAEDLQQLPGGAYYALATAPMVDGVPGETTYLGSLLVEDMPTPATREAVDALRRQGLEIVARRDAEALRDGDLPVVLEPEGRVCLIAPSLDAAGLDAAVDGLVRHVRHAEDRLRATGLLLALILVCWLTMRLRPYVLLLYLPVCGLFAFLGADTLPAGVPWIRRALALLVPGLIGAMTRGFLGLVLPDGTGPAMACCLGSLCLTLIPPMAFGSRRARWIFTVLIIVLLPAVNALLLHAELAVIFASVSGSLCAVAYRCLLGQD